MFPEDNFSLSFIELSICHKNCLLITVLFRFNTTQPAEHQCFTVFGPDPMFLKIVGYYKLKNKRQQRTAPSGSKLYYHRQTVSGSLMDSDVTQIFAGTCKT